MHNMTAGQDTEQTIQAHYTQFYLKFNSNLADKDHTAYPLSDEMLMKITNFMLAIKDGSTVGKLKNYICYYKWDWGNYDFSSGKRKIWIHINEFV